MARPIRINSLSDLVRYLEARKMMAENQRNERKFAYESGMVYAYEESLRAVRSLLAEESSKKPETQPIAR